MEKNKKAIVGLIFAITSVLAGLSIYVSWELRSDISPEDSSAQVSTPVPTEVLPTVDISKKKGVPTKTTPTKIVATVRPSGSGTLATPQPSRPLPSTALINNRADAAIIGSLMILVGLVLYKKYLYFGDRERV